MTSSRLNRQSRISRPSARRAPGPPSPGRLAYAGPRRLTITRPRGYNDESPDSRPLGVAQGRATDCVEQEEVIGLGQGPQVEEDRAATDARDGRRFAPAEGARPGRFRLEGGGEGGLDAHDGRRDRLDR